MSMWRRPSHRVPERMEQLEVCDVCGLLVPISRLVVCDVEGLRGRVVCDVHRIERRMRFAPSFHDMQALWGGNLAPDAGTRQEPIGAAFWFSDAGAILREDGFYILKEDNNSYITREA